MAAGSFGKIKRTGGLLTTVLGGLIKPIAGGISGLASWGAGKLRG